MWIRNSPTGKALGEAIQIMHFAPAGFDEEIADKQPHKYLRDPFLPVQLAKKLL